MRGVLTNETYTGRTLFRRAQRVVNRNPVTGRHTRRVVERPPEAWIEVPDASPRIIDQQLWERVQQIITDPERPRRRPQGRFYLLSARARCALCGSAMVGQTLTVRGAPFWYYRCRHAYDKNTGYTCSARYVRGPELERAVWAEIRRVLADPLIVVRELEVQRRQAVDTAEVTRLEDQATALREREKRLVRLYGLGDVDEAVAREELMTVRRQRTVIEERLRELQRPNLLASAGINEGMLAQTCAAVGAWLDRAGEQERVLALEALQVVVEAAHNAATVTGVLPAEPPTFICGEASCRCSFNGD